ncbi:MAG: metallophosphoesterase [Paenibacillus sp.]|nr:metallophosphoesterase [Paenibacillus sp.]
MNEQKLKFRQDGTFTIAQFTDVHWIDGCEADMRSRALMDKVIQEERPDLVVFTGDIIYTKKSKEGEPPAIDPRHSLHGAVASVEQQRVRWAWVLGNHDAERNITREQLADEFAAFEYVVSSKGPDHISGYGNFVLELEGRDGSCAAALYGFDTGDYSKLAHVRGYDWIRRDQIDWYLGESRRLTERNGGEPLPALAFFHIPLPEYRQVWETAACYGEKHEDVCAPQLNSGMFAAMVESCDVLGTFCGHDHVNDYCGELHGIKLCYGRATGYNTYGREGFPRGARLIRLVEGERSFASWLRLDDGTIILQQPEHQPNQG